MNVWILYDIDTNPERIATIYGVFDTIEKARDAQAKLIREKVICEADCLPLWECDLNRLIRNDPCDRKSFAPYGWRI